MKNKESLNEREIGGEETGNYPIDMGDYNIELYYVDNDGFPVGDEFMTMDSFESDRKFYESICKISLPNIGDLFCNNDVLKNEQSYLSLKEKTWRMDDDRVTLELHIV